MIPGLRSACILVSLWLTMVRCMWLTFDKVHHTIDLDSSLNIGSGEIVEGVFDNSVDFGRIVEDFDNIVRFVLDYMMVVGSHYLETVDCTLGDTWDYYCV